MALAHSLQRLIRLAYAKGFDNLHRLPCEKIRQILSHPYFKCTVNTFEEYAVNPSVKLRCYFPDSKQPQLNPPAIIYLPANAFILDRFAPSQYYCSELANTADMCVIQIAHRLAPEHKFPTFLDDCLEAIEWISQNACRLHIDKDRLSIWGESSGASLAATCTHLLRDAQKNYLKYQTLFYPLVEINGTKPSRKLFESGYMLDKTFIDWLDSRAFHPSQNRTHWLVSPLNATNFNNLPPTTIITAQYDPLRDEGKAYAQKLMAANGHVVQQHFDDMIHGFMRFYPKLTQTRLALNFAVSHLKNALNITTVRTFIE